MTFAAFDQGAQAPYYPTTEEVEALIGCHWTHRRKGGRYRVEAIAKGAGTIHGRLFVFYSELPKPTMIYTRPLGEWHFAMEAINDQD